MWTTAQVAWKPIIPLFHTFSYVNYRTGSLEEVSQHPPNGKIVNYRTGSLEEVQRIDIIV